MSDLYQSTNKLADNTYPERSHLLLEGIIDVGTYETFGGGSWLRGRAVVDLTNISKIGDRFRGFPPETLDAKAWLNRTAEGGAFGLVDWARPLNFVNFNSSGTLQEWGNLYIDVRSEKFSSDFESTLILDHYVLSVPSGERVSFSYKVYNTLYKYNDLV